MKKLFFFSLLCLIMASCESLQVISSPQVNKTPAFDIQGHRGARGLMPENTIPAFLKGLDVGATTLEMDAAITKDGKVILSHDPFFVHDIALRPDGKSINQNEERGINLYKLNYNEIETYDVGSKGNAAFPQQQKVKAFKPLLSDVIDSAEAHARKINRALPFYNIEIKSHQPFDNLFYPPVGKYTDMVMAVILQKNIAERVIIQSFDVRALKYMHQKYPAFKLALNLDNFGTRTLSDTLTSLGFTPYILSTNSTSVNESLIQQCKAKGIKIIAYTVNDLGEMKRLKALGLDGIITDYPNVAKDNL